MIVLCLENTCALRDFQQMLTLSMLDRPKKLPLYTLGRSFRVTTLIPINLTVYPLKKYVAWCKIPSYVIEYKSPKLQITFV